ncbi:MAG: LacI family DNA-binding transcriptional regulator [Bacillota bacterium]|nr:LacI family DNA-binding transcriptional regulator [Bacillota bacterium]
MIIIASTIKDIAALCGVSEGTVDRALNNRSGISEKTKSRILQAARELDYHPNHLARSLAKGSTYTIGVVCINLSNNFFSLLIEAIEAIAKENGYFINLILTHNDPVREMEGIRYLAGRKVDGLIIFPVGMGKEYEKELKKLNVPIVTVYNRISSDFIHVDVDGRQIMRNAVSYIVQKGYSRVIYMDVGIQNLRRQGINIYSMEERRNGYLEGIKDEMMKEIVLEDFDKDRIIQLVESEKHGKAAVLCSYDVLAIKVLNLFRERGIKVPDQAGIMGFDNIDILKTISPRIQSVDCGIRNLGRKAFSILLRQINKDRNVHDCVIGYSFTEGETL